MGVLNAISVPHPPIIIPDVGNGKEKEISKTTKAYENAIKFIETSKPETIIIISPHSPYYFDYFHILTKNEIYGDMSKFGAFNQKYTLDYDYDFIDELSKEYPDCGYLGEKNESIDHGVLVPMYFIKKQISNVKFIVIGLSALPLKEHYKLGMIISKVAKKLDRKVSIIASGDLSHKLKEDGPYGYNENGPIYDSDIMDILSKSSFGELIGYDSTILSDATECGHPSFVIMAGCFDRLNVKAKKLSYEGPFGVGYGVCTFAPLDKNPGRNFYDKYLVEEQNNIKKIRRKESKYVKLARTAIELYVKTGKVLSDTSNIDNSLFAEKSAVFVTLHKYDNLRGCIGTITPIYPTMAEEIIHNAVAACSSDNRFEPVRMKELDYITYSVDVLSSPEDIENQNMLDPKKYGVIVSNFEGKRGLLLPNIDGVDTIEEQISVARKKAGIFDQEEIFLKRFQVKRYY